MDLGFVVALSVAGIDLGPAVLYSLSLGMVSLVFAAYAAVCAQVVLHSRGVYALGFVVVGLSYVLRGVGDVKDTFWVWLSPLGWLEKTAAVRRRPALVGPPIPMAVALGLSVLAVVARRTARPRVDAVPPGPGCRLGVQVAGAPARARTACSARFVPGMDGGLAGTGRGHGRAGPRPRRRDTGKPVDQQAMGVSGQDTTAGVLAMTEVYLALIACGYVVQALGTLRHEEVGGRLEPVLAGSLGRLRWLGAQLVGLLGGLVLVVAGSAVVFGATTALSTGRSGYIRILLKAGLAYLPAELRRRRCRRPLLRARPASLRPRLGRIRSVHLHRPARPGPPALAVDPGPFAVDARRQPARRPHRHLNARLARPRGAGSHDSSVRHLPTPPGSTRLRQSLTTAPPDAGLCLRADIRHELADEQWTASVRVRGWRACSCSECERSERQHDVVAGIRTCGHFAQE